MRRALASLAAGWALLLAAWVVGNPPFAAPDEAAHYVRALGAAQGDWSGVPARVAPPPGLAADVAARQVAWVDQSTRAVRVAGRLAPLPDCYVRDPRATAACLERASPVPVPAGGLVTTVGTYQPLPYALPSVAVEAAEGPAGGVRLARVAGALPALALLLAAAWALGPGAPLLGLLVAVTPMALFSAATLNGSGLEIAGGIAFAAALVRIARGGAPAGAWALAAAAGAVLALSRSTGPLWAVLLLAVVPVLAGRAGTVRVVREGGSAAAATAAALLAAVAGNRLWEAAQGPEVILSLVNPRSGLRGGIGQFRDSSPELIGRFGYLEYDLPGLVLLAWAAVALGLLALGLRAAPRPRRLALLAAVAAAAALPVALYVLVIRHTGFGLQGRHVLPVLAALPLLAGELAARRPPSARLLAAAGGVLAAAQLAAWWFNARRSAVGIDGPVWFSGAAEWAPPGGWLPWALCALAGAVLAANAARVTIRE